MNEDARERWQSQAFLQTAHAWLQEIFQDRRNSSPRDLRGITVGTTALDPFLRDKDFRNCRLFNADLSQGLMDVPFDACVFDKVRLADATLAGCSLIRSGFYDCIFDRAALHIQGNDARFERCSFAGTRITVLPNTIYRGGERMVFKECDLEGTFLNELLLAEAQFIDCRFSDMRFENCDLHGAKFYVTVPDLPQFVQCNLHGAKFSYDFPADA